MNKNRTHKYFVISDMHSYHKATLSALNKERFQINADNQTLIVNGDIFDRGPESKEMREWLDTVNNKIMILGNHETLLLLAITRGYFVYADLMNGLIDTAIQLAGGYDLFPELVGKNKAIEYFTRRGYSGDINDIDLHIRIIRKLIDTDIVEWIVDNFFDDGEDETKGVEWDEDREHFSLKGKPRWYIQVDNRLILHGFFPSPDYQNLPEDFNLLEDSTWEMWNEHSCGVWSNTPYWLDQYHSYKLKRLYDLLTERKIEHIYIGHWGRQELLKPNYVSVNESDFNKYGMLPKLYFTDNTTVLSNMIWVETFRTFNRE